MKPSIPQGTRDFSAAVLRKRSYILDTIRNVFLLYGFEPLETPAMEHTETLMEKYGEEGDKLLFKILNNGLHLPEKKESALSDFQQVLEGKTTKGITERALRYDLTIPFARYVAMNHQQLTLPYKRFQMQPVWRADRPQRGRYREFWQCDADVAGSLSLLHESELVNIYTDVFGALQLSVSIHINNRKILSALATVCGGEDLMSHITVAIDKLDKIGPQKVKDELIGKGLSMEQVEKVESYMSIQGDNEQRLQQLEELFGAVPVGKEGINEIRQVLSLAKSTSHTTVVVDPSLARGLNYYTGTIFEIKASGVEMGSIGGGGRYDDLTGLFGVKGIPGVGISFGVDRIFDVMEELNRFPDHIHSGTTALIFRTSESELRYQMHLADALRNQSISCEIFHEQVKFDKQFKYADRKGIPYVIIAGSEELQKQTYLVKNRSTGEQREYALDQLISLLKA
ncbi:MAG: histidine--tRNA ligase [Bacteroidetes bacterium]|nr:histidine--tRNA ligase [Bacteroidota bacterium]